MEGIKCAVKSYRKARTNRCNHRAARFGFGRRFLGRLGIGCRVFPATSAAQARRIRDTDHSRPARVRSFRLANTSSPPARRSTA
jgi:hypothetical protein